MLVDYDARITRPRRASLQIRRSQMGAFGGERGIRTPEAGHRGELEDFLINSHDSKDLSELPAEVPAIPPALPRAESI